MDLSAFLLCSTPPSSLHMDQSQLCLYFWNDIATILSCSVIGRAQTLTNQHIQHIAVQFSAGIDVPQTVFIIVLVLNSSLWLIPAGNSNSATVHEEPPQMRAPPPLMRDHPSWPVVELFMYNLVLGLCKISPNTGRSGEKDDVETCWIPHGRCWGFVFKFWHRINAKCLTAGTQWSGRYENDELKSPYERWVNIQSSYTDSKGKFSYGFENLY